MSGERFYGDYLVAPLIGFKDPPTGGVRVCRIVELINDKAGDCKFPLRESKDKSERSLENVDINYTHMFNDKTEDNKPVLSEFASTLNSEPTLDKLNAEMDRFEFTKNETWTLTTEERAKVLLEEPVLTGGSSSSGTTSGVSEASPTSVKARIDDTEKSLGLNRQNKPRFRLKPEDVLPGGPKWERTGERVIRRYTGTDKPVGVWPEAWRMTSHKERNKLVKEAKEFL